MCFPYCALRDSLLMYLLTYFYLFIFLLVHFTAQATHCSPSGHSFPQSFRPFPLPFPSERVGGPSGSPPSLAHQIFEARHFLSH